MGLPRRIPVTMTTVWVFLAALMVFSNLRHAAAQIPCRYSIAHTIQGPTHPTHGPPTTVGMAISPNGRLVCGYYTYIIDKYPFVFDTQTGHFTTLPLTHSAFSSAQDVNDSGLVVGQAAGIGFIYDLTSGQITYVPTGVPSAGQCIVNAINANGVACGARTISTNPTRDNAFILSAEGIVTDLGLVDGQSTMARGISDVGIVVGFTGNSGISTGARAFSCKNTDLTLFRPVPGALNSTAAGIDAFGRILMTGITQQSPVLGVAYLFDQGDFTALPPLDGFKTIQVRGMSEHGLVVGNSGNPSVGMTATAWFQGVPVNLEELINELNVLIDYGGDIANSGRVLANGQDLEFNALAVVLDAVNRAAGDTDCDGFVGIQDLLHVITDWGPCLGCSTDLNGDQSVNIHDLLLVIANWD